MSEEETVKQIENLIKKDLKEAMAICESFPDSEIIQAYAIEIAIRMNNFELAYEIGRKFPDSPVVQAKVMKTAEKTGNVELVEEIAKKFPNDSKIQSKLINNRIKSGKIKEALIIAERFPENEVIQSQHINVLIQDGKLKEAKEIGIKFPHYKIIQSQMMKIAIMEDDIGTIKKISNRFKGNYSIQRQRILYYISKKNFDKASSMIYHLSKKAPNILELRKLKNIVEQEILKDNARREELNFFKTCLDNDLTNESFIDMVLSSDVLSDYEKSMIIIAIYEKVQVKYPKTKYYKTALGYIKEFSLSDQERKNVNRFLDRLKINKIWRFDPTIYSEMLKWNYDSSIERQISSENDAKKLIDKMRKTELEQSQK